MKPSFVQIAIVILIIVIIFGAPKLPQLARSLGQSMKIFKSEVKDMKDDKDETSAKNHVVNGEVVDNETGRGSHSAGSSTDNSDVRDQGTTKN